MPNDAITELARIAHRFWCDRMARLGWVYGERFDAAMRTHDALQPFDRLGLRDKMTARSVVELEEFGDRLARALDYPRGPDRPFEAKELRPGIRVGWAGHVQLAERDATQEVGTIESWEFDPASQELILLRVRWTGGQLTEHAPDEGDLIRLDPA